MTRISGVKWLVAVALAAFGAGAGVSWWLARPAEPAARSEHPVAPAAAVQVEGLPRPAFGFEDLEGVRREIVDFEGSWTVVNFWATWCAPCLREIPAFVELQARYLGDGVRFVGVALDETEPVREFAAQVGLNYPTMSGRDDALDLLRAYGNRTGGLPYTVFIDPAGRVEHTHAGELSHEEAERLITAFLAP